jgi:hypothetical protein
MCRNRKEITSTSQPRLQADVVALAHNFRAAALLPFGEDRKEIQP